MSLHDDARASLFRILRTTKDPTRAKIAYRALQKLPGPDAVTSIATPDAVTSIATAVHLIRNDGVSVCEAVRTPSALSVVRGAQSRVVDGQDPSMTLDVDATTCTECLREIARSLENIVHARGSTPVGSGACGVRGIPERLLCDDAQAATCVGCLGSEIAALREQRHYQRVQVPSFGPGLREDVARIIGLLEGAAGGFTLVREDREVVLSILRACR